MLNGLNKFLEWISDFLAHRKGLLIMIGICLVVINLVFQLIPGAGWLAQSNLFLHLGVILGLAGILLAWAL